MLWFYLIIAHMFVYHILKVAFIIELNLFSKMNKVYIIEKFNTDIV